MAAQRLITILPEMTQEESMKTTTIYSVTGILEKYEPLITNPPFREVHHTITKAALVGGGLYPVPGEISLVNGGVLFTAEFSTRYSGCCFRACKARKHGICEN